MGYNRRVGVTLKAPTADYDGGVLRCFVFINEKLFDSYRRDNFNKLVEYFEDPITGLIDIADYFDPDNMPKNEHIKYITICE